MKGEEELYQDLIYINMRSEPVINRILPWISPLDGASLHRVIFSDGFSCLKQMVYLRLVQIRISLVYKLIQKLTTFPNACLGLV